MNALTTTPNTQAPVRPASATPQAIAKSLVDIQAHLLQVFDDWEALCSRHPCLAADARCYRDDPIARLPYRRTPESDASTAQQAEYRLGRFPPEADMRALSERIRATLSEPQDTTRVRFLLGLLVDSFPAVRAHSPESYFEALVHEITVSGHPPSIVARACSTLRRSATFLPSVAEVLTACEAAGATLVGARRVLEWAVNVRADAERALELLTQPPPAPENPMGEIFPLPTEYSALDNTSDALMASGH